MASSDLAASSLFQLNVLIWATLPQPPGAPVTPLLTQAGYSLWSIEQPLPASLSERPALQAHPDVRPNPVADALLQHGATATAILVECKPGSFGTASGRAPQARGLLAAGANVVHRLPSIQAKACHAWFVVPMEGATTMGETLAGFRAFSALPDKPATCPATPVGIAVEADGVYLGLPDRLPDCAPLPDELVPPGRVISSALGQDPRPLYIVPWIPDAPDEDLEAFKEKVRSRVLAWLGLAGYGAPSSLQYDELLSRISQGVYGLWRDRSSLEGRVYVQLQGLLDRAFGGDPRVAVHRREVVVTPRSAQDVEQLMERLRTARFPERLPTEVQLRMEIEG